MTPEPGTVEYLREALDWIDAHAPEGEEASQIAQAALAGTWESPECCNGHGLERRPLGTPIEVTFRDGSREVIRLPAADDAAAEYARDLADMDAWYADDLDAERASGLHRLAEDASLREAEDPSSD